MATMPGRTLRTLAASVACASVLLCGGTGAVAAKTVTGDVENLSISDINSNAQGELTVIVPRYNGKPLAGVGLTLEKISGIDLTTTRGWDQAVALTVEEAKDAEKLATYTVRSDSEGKVTFSQLTVGVYYLTQTDSEGLPEDYRTTIPEVLTIPVGDKETGAWRYTFTAHAKGQPAVKPHEPETPVTTTPERPYEPWTPATPVVPNFPPDGATPRKPPTELPHEPEEPSGTPVTTPPQPKPQQPSKPRLPSLPNTGANVITVGLGGLMLLILGAVLVAAKRRKKTH